MKMKATYIQRGETIDYKNETANTIELDSVVSLGTRIAVAGDNIASGEIGALHTVGVFSIPKAAEEITVGSDVYYDETNDCITATQGTNIPAGYAVQTASASDAKVNVKLLG